MLSKSATSFSYKQIYKENDKCKEIYKSRLEKHPNALAAQLTTCTLEKTCCLYSGVRMSRCFY